MIHTILMRAAEDLILSWKLKDLQNEKSKNICD